MKYRPILFSTQMVQAILCDRKSQTRRVIEPQPKTHFRKDDRLSFSQRSNGNWEAKDTFSNDGFSNLDSFSCKYGNVGDVLWVRESMIADNDNQAVYKADGSFVFLNSEPRLYDSINISYFTEAKNHVASIHMPKSACRIFLQITEILVERLNKISEQDAVAEGILPVKSFDSGSGISSKQMYHNYLDQGYTELLPIDSFQSLWISINGQKSWDDNPWVWVISFKRIPKPLDFI